MAARACSTGVALLVAASALGGCIPQAPRLAPAYLPAQDKPDDRTHADDARYGQPRSPPPAWQARPVVGDAQQIAPTRYTVRPGDSLTAIADRTGAGLDAIARANRLTFPFVIRAGEQLTIPGGRYHLVRAGQTGIAIARAYGVEWSQIVSANALTDPYTLRVGMRVLIPGGPRTLAERAAAFTLDVDDIMTGGEPALATSRRPASPSRSATRLMPSSAAINAPTRLSGGFSWPVHGRLVSKFGPGASGTRNNGVKIAVPVDTPILAAADGVVAYAGDEITSLGGLVLIRHADGWTTVYGHARRLLVQRGQTVKRGQTIALSGDSGNATRPELHYEMRKGRTPIDPITQMPPL